MRSTFEKARLGGALLALAVFAVSAPAAAGVRYTTVTKTSSGDTSTARVEAEGQAIRIEFQDRGDATFGAGDYLVSQDGGATIFWVEPKKQRYAEIDFERIAQITGRILQGVPALFWVKIEEPRVAKLFEEEGPVLHGLPTRHARYLMTYRERSRLTLPSRRGANSTREETWSQVIQDVWYSLEVAAPSADIWMRDRFRRSGYEDLDRFLAAETSLIEGFPLRVETFKVSASRDLEQTRVRLSRDRSSVSQTFYLGSGFKEREIQYTANRSEVTALETTAEPLAIERFRPPAGFAAKTAAR